MSKRNNIRLAIGYGFGMGMFLGGVFIIVGHFVTSIFDFDVGLFVIVAVIMIGGLIIAMYNSLKLKIKETSTVKDSTE
jgi:ABC-type antimicrobial peptide transport system permease subunit